MDTSYARGWTTVGPLICSSTATNTNTFLPPAALPAHDSTYHTCPVHQHGPTYVTLQEDKSKTLSTVSS